MCDSYADRYRASALGVLGLSETYTLDGFGLVAYAEEEDVGPLY